MPLYDFDCADCGGFQLMRRIADRDAPASCPHCGTLAARVFVPPSFALMDGGLRLAHAVNERAKHEPKRSAGHVHGPNCGCGSKGKGATLKGANGNKAFPTKRPWMISH